MSLSSFDVRTRKQTIRKQFWSWILLLARSFLNGTWWCKCFHPQRAAHSHKKFDTNWGPFLVSSFHGIPNLTTQCSEKIRAYSMPLGFYVGILLVSFVYLCVPTTKNWVPSLVLRRGRIMSIPTYLKTFPGKISLRCLFLLRARFCAYEMQSQTVT